MLKKHILGWIFGALLICPGIIFAQSPQQIDATEGITADFALLDKDGNLVTAADYLGNFVLIGFGFTRCPHICPMMAASMGSVLKSTSSDAVGIFISVDTERDPPAITHEYAAGFNERMLGLGGDYNQVAEAAKNFKVTYSVSKSPDNFTVQHTTNTYLLGPDGALLEIFALNTTPAEMLAAIERHGSP